MSEELVKKGLKVNFVVVNAADAQDTLSNLTAVFQSPIFQDTTTVDAWKLHGCGKDDMVVYDKYGKVFKFLGFWGNLDTNLSDPVGYKNVLGVIEAALLVK